jgi:hypothetical protein
MEKINGRALTSYLDFRRSIIHHNQRTLRRKQINKDRAFGFAKFLSPLPRRLKSALSI